MLTVIAWSFLFLFVYMSLAFNRASLIVWTTGIFAYLFFFSILSGATLWVLTPLWILFTATALFLNVPVLRRSFLTQRLFKIYQKKAPKLSQTEKEALTAGEAGWIADIFSGMPDWNKLQNIPNNKLTSEEQAFIEGPVETLCQMINDWEINQIYFQIPDAIWSHLKNHGFFGLIIPKEYGGKAFSAYAHSQVIVKLATVSVAVGTVVSVPNSLGPAELLLAYGTEEQKNHYLPKLAQGKEIPCFALTSPIAGSDASAIVDSGIVCYQEIEGKQELGILLNWDKRYITLAPVATLLGLAFKLYDPEHLLGEQENIGITCALIPVSTPGITIGRYHYPVTCAFPNGPTQGKNVFISLSQVIGGKAMLGQGWRMLMECLAAGRGISIPSMVCGGAKRASYTSGSYAKIRRQFNTSISAFGGIQEVLAEIGGLTYLMEGTRLFTLACIDQGTHPVVAAAISKYQTTQLARQVSTHAMDLHGGKAICMGPKNYLAQAHFEGAISITVEGANILTRSLIIFGQGAIRCHPYVLEEIQASQNPNEKEGLIAFDKAIFKHMGMFLSNHFRAFFLGITRGRMAAAPKGELKRYYQQFSRFTAAFAFTADFSMMTLGNHLKRNEYLSGRLADLLSYLYMGSSVLKHYEAENNKEEWPLICWACDYLLFKLKTQFENYIANFPNRGHALILRSVIFPVKYKESFPKDALSRKVAETLFNPSFARQRFSEGTYQSFMPNNPASLIEKAFQKVISMETIEKKFHTADRQGLLKGFTLSEKITAAMQAEILTAEEARQFVHAEEIRSQALAVDDFNLVDIQKQTYSSHSIPENSHNGECVC